MKPAAHKIQEMSNLNRFPIVSRGKSSIGYRTGRNQITYQCTTSPIHYMDGGVWKPITLKHSNGKFEGVPFGWNGDHITHNGSLLIKPMSITFNGKKHNIVLKPDFDNNRLVDDIKGIGEYSITIKPNSVKEKLVVYEPLDGLLEFDVRDGSGKNSLYSVERYIDGYGSVGNSIYLTKDMEYPLTIDPSYYIDTDCGIIYGMSATQSTARSTSSYGYMNDTHISTGWYKNGSSSINYRGFIKFNTTDVGSGTTVTQANAYMYSWSTQAETGSGDVYIVNNDWSAYDPITSGNRESAYDAAKNNQEDYVVLAAALAFNGDLLVSPNLDVTWINKTGYTYYAMLDSDDYHSNDTATIQSNCSTFTSYSSYLELITEGAPAGWTNIYKVNGVLSSSIAKVDGKEVASISKVNGVAV